MHQLYCKALYKSMIRAGASATRFDYKRTFFFHYNESWLFRGWERDFLQLLNNTLLQYTFKTLHQREHYSISLQNCRQWHAMAKKQDLRKGFQMGWSIFAYSFSCLQFGHFSTLKISGFISIRLWQL